MTVKIYVGTDSKDNINPPGFYHEMHGVAFLAKQCWSAFHHRENPYALVINLRWPQADMVVLSSRGVGVVELKHHDGVVRTRDNGVWYADDHEIHAGKYFHNPHEQVQSYAKIIHASARTFLLPDRSIKFRIQTAVCFTRGQADLQALEQTFKPKTEIWEDFKLLTSADFVEWVDALRLGYFRETSNGYMPYLLTPSHIETFATVGLSGREWNDFYQYMPSGQPYAVLRFEQPDGVKIFPLTQDRIVIGRDPSCDIVIPEQYDHVSRKHIRIERCLDGVFLEDLQSHNGTYLGAQSKVDKRIQLQNGQKLYLGRIFSGKRSCKLIYLLPEYADLTLTQTKSAPLPDQVAGVTDEIE